MDLYVDIRHESCQVSLKSLFEGFSRRGKQQEWLLRLLRSDYSATAPEKDGFYGALAEDLEKQSLAVKMYLVVFLKYTPFLTFLLTESKSSSTEYIMLYIISCHVVSYC